MRRLLSFGRNSNSSAGVGELHRQYDEPISVHELLRKMKRLIAVAIGAMAGQGVMLILPFAVPIKQFAALAAVLAISQLIGAIGGFSLELSCPRLSVRLSKAILYSVATIAIASFIVLIGFKNDLSLRYAAGVTLAWLVTLTNILHSYILFSGQVRSYASLGIGKALVFLLTFALLIKLGSDPVLSWLLAASLSLAYILAFSILRNSSDEIIKEEVLSTWKDVFAFSAPSAVIVAIGALPFVLDRAIAQTYLGPADFARYTVAVTWAAPLLYLGNIFTNSMISSRRDETLKSIARSSFALVAMSILYMIFVAIAARYFIKIPFYANGKDFLKIWGVIAGWFVAYSAVSSPVAAVVQKSFHAYKLKKLAVIMAVNIAICLGAVALLLQIFGRPTFSPMLEIALGAMVAAFLGIGPKVVFVFRHVRHG